MVSLLAPQERCGASASVRTSSSAAGRASRDRAPARGSRWWRRSTPAPLLDTALRRQRPGPPPALRQGHCWAPITSTGSRRRAFRALAVHGGDCDEGQQHADNGIIHPAVDPNSLALRQRQPLIDGRRIVLPSLEFEVLHYLRHHEGATVPRYALLADIWGYQSDIGSNVVEAVVHTLRKKLGAHASTSSRPLVAGNAPKASPGNVAPASILVTGDTT